MAEALNCREFTRVKIGVKVDMSTSNGAWAKGTVLDLSGNGVFFSCDQRVEAMAAERCGTCLVTMHLDVCGAPILVEAGGKVTRVDDKGMAVEFNGIDMDSLEHLHNLVRFNSPDTDKVEEEFESHIGLKPRPSSDS